MAGRHEDSDDESYARIGSAFEILQTDEDIVKAKEKKQKDQYVLDKQGRRRFHGAFTGGFSAGYYNTVGSKEGILCLCNICIIYYIRLGTVFFCILTEHKISIKETTT